MKQFPSYHQIKVQDAGASRTQEPVADASDTEEASSLEYVKGLQRLLNAARRSDAKLRKLQQDKSTKSEQWAEFQTALRGKFLEQRSLFQKDMKSIEKDITDISEQKRAVLSQIQDAVRGDGRGTAAGTRVTAQPTREDLAAPQGTMRPARSRYRRLPSCNPPSCGLAHATAQDGPSHAVHAPDHCGQCQRATPTCCRHRCGSFWSASTPASPLAQWRILTTFHLRPCRPPTQLPWPKLCSGRARSSRKSEPPSRRVPGLRGSPAHRPVG